MIETGIFVAATLAVLAAAVLIAGWFLRRPRKTQPVLLRRFGLDSAWEIVGTDLGGDDAPISLAGRGLQGRPDAVFRHVHRPEIVIGEFKARNYRAQMRFREWYQLLLYMGLARVRWPRHEIRGRMRYRDVCLEVAYDPEVFEALITLREELKNQEGQGTLPAWLGGAPRPLQKRERGFAARMRARQVA